MIQRTGRLPGTKGYNKLTIVEEFPPNIEAIRRVFSLSGEEIFAWGSIIFNPANVKLTRALLAHERTHSKQQGDDIEKWWHEYLTNPKFRFEQELEAHQVEYAVFNNTELNRNRRRVHLKQISKRLSSPMYGRMTTFDKARKIIKAGPKKIPNEFT